MIKQVQKVILEFSDGSISGASRINKVTGDAHIWFSEKEPSEIGYFASGETTLEEIECAPVTFVFKNVASIEALAALLEQTKIAMVKAREAKKTE